MARRRGELTSLAQVGFRRSAYPQRGAFQCLFWCMFHLEFQASTCGTMRLYLVPIQLLIINLCFTLRLGASPCKMAFF
jgi:hypothetical protein